MKKKETFTKEEFENMKSIALSRGWIGLVDNVWKYRFRKEKRWEIPDIEWWVLSRLFMNFRAVPRHFDYKYIPEKGEYLCIF